MNSNWRTPEEAKKLFCHRNDGPCISNACAYWLWRPCDACDTGTVINRDSNNLVHTKCQVCNGTGTDGSGLGRCGLVRG